MRLDCHVHTNYGEVSKDTFLSRLNKAGLDGGIIFSQGPARMGDKEIPSKHRIENVLEWTQNEKYLFPFFFMDPTSEEAIEDVNLAVSMGIKGFKVICFDFYPSDPRAIPVFEKIAKAGLPILFHSGILWDGKNPSSKYNRPVEFEALLSIDGLKFALAHISWPWTDECFAVFSKYKASLSQGGNFASTAEMFMDATPGAPASYRKDLLEKLLLTGKDTEGFDTDDNIIWGVDSLVNDYNFEYALKIQKHDDAILEQLGISKQVQEKIYYKNTLRFLGAAE